MGLFAAKAASKPQDTSKETKAEAKEAPGVSYLRPFGLTASGFVLIQPH